MSPEDVLSIRPLLLTSRQREDYFTNGYLLLENLVSKEELETLNAVTAEMIEQSRDITKSDQKWDIEPGHTRENPMLRRLASPNDHHEAYWNYASNSKLTDAITDLVGPDVKFHHSKLNFKWSGGGEEVKWHQDISFWPHTNYSPLTAGTYLQDCGSEQGPLGVIKGSHLGPLYNQYDENGTWTGALNRQDSDNLDESKIVYLEGPAGSVTIHNCRTVHGSPANLSPNPRPLLLNVYSSADAYTYTPNPLYSKYDQHIVRGKKAQWAVHDSRPCQVPPDWSAGYSSIFALQQQEEQQAK